MNRHLLRLVKDADLAEDLLQETYIRLWSHIEEWENISSPRSWLIKIATNIALSHLRKKRRRPSHASYEGQTADDEGDLLEPSWMEDHSTPGPDELLERSEEVRMLRRLVEELSEEKQEVMRLVLNQDLSVGEVSEALDVPEGTVKSRLHYAKRDIANRWISDKKP